MTAATMAPSAYPAAVEALIPQARELADQLGEVPSRNRLMKEFKVGAPKAIALREALTQTDPVPPVLVPILTVADEGAALFGTTETADPTPDTSDDTDRIEPVPVAVVAEETPQGDPVGHPDAEIATPAPVEMPPPPVKAARRPVAWPVLLLALPAFVAIWSGWVSLGELSGFGIVHPLPGIADNLTINTAITLPIGVETYAAYALWVWLSGRAPLVARKFAKWSAIGSLVFGAAGQIAYHLMAAAGMTSAPWLITAAVACLPVAVLGMGAALAHLLHSTDQ
ncbi:ABC transporter permease [Actinoplanes sp. NPDC049599]|uniref:ABC transporter permease n=1 Tax=Actinoplanes sp. NPDC049599 TaxID=3363903 RepID=UPI003790E913